MKKHSDEGLNQAVNKTSEVPQIGEWCTRIPDNNHPAGTT
jgi:hypothetical protein